MSVSPGVIQICIGGRFLYTFTAKMTFLIQVQPLFYLAADCCKSRAPIKCLKRFNLILYAAQKSLAHAHTSRQAVSATVPLPRQKKTKQPMRVYICLHVFVCM